MRTPRFFYLLAAVIVLAGGAGVAAGETDTPAVEGDDAVLFTNADLAKFGPPTGPDEPVADAVAANANTGDWAFVQGFIDSQYERLDAERQHSMEIATAEEQNREPEWDGWSGNLLLAPWSYWGPYGRYPVPRDGLGTKKPGHGKRPVHDGRGLGRVDSRGGSGRYLGIRARSAVPRGGGGGNRR